MVVATYEGGGDGAGKGGDDKIKVFGIVVLAIPAFETGNASMYLSTAGGVYVCFPLLKTSNINFGQF